MNRAAKRLSENAMIIRQTFLSPALITHRQYSSGKKEALAPVAIPLQLLLRPSFYSVCTAAKLTEPVQTDLEPADLTTSTRPWFDRSIR